jgi:hypothetical protein
MIGRVHFISFNTELNERTQEIQYIYEYLIEYEDGTSITSSIAFRAIKHTHRYIDVFEKIKTYCKGELIYGRW